MSAHDNQFDYEDTYLSGSSGGGLSGTGSTKKGMNSDEPFTPLDKELHTSTLRYGLGGGAFGFEQDPDEEKVTIFDPPHPHLENPMLRETVGGGGSDSPSDGAVKKDHINNAMFIASRSHGGKLRRSTVSVQVRLSVEDYRHRAMGILFLRTAGALFLVE